MTSSHPGEKHKREKFVAEQTAFRNDLHAYALFGSVLTASFIFLVTWRLFISLGKSVKNSFLFTMTAYPGQTLTTLGQIVRRPMVLPITRPIVIQPWNRTRVCNDAPSTEKQCHRLLRSLGAQGIHVGLLAKNRSIITGREVLTDFLWSLQIEHDPVSRLSRPGHDTQIHSLPTGVNHLVCYTTSALSVARMQIVYTRKNIHPTDNSCL